MALNVLDEKTRDVMTASYALPDLETAVQQVIYNAIDAHAKTIKISVNVANASFTAVDDGDGILPDDLYTYIGECFGEWTNHSASSKLPISKSDGSEQKQQKTYGCRGAFLYELISLATTVEIESRVQKHWTSYRKVFQEGAVVFNARSKELHSAPGTKVSVSNLFGKFPVRCKDLSRNMKHRTRVIQNIQNLCVSLSMIWHSLSFDIRFQGGEVRPVIIPAAKSCRERFLAYFGQLLGDELQYVSFSSKTAQFSIRGYFAFIPSGSEGLEQGIKQAKSYYQFAFLENKWVDECHQLCSRAITDAALEYSSSIPIFVLKVEAPRDQYDISGIGKKEQVLFKAPDQFCQFLFEFVQKLAEANQVEIQELNTREVVTTESVDHQPAASLSFREHCGPLLNISCPIVSPDAKSSEPHFPQRSDEYDEDVDPEYIYWDQVFAQDEHQLLEYETHPVLSGVYEEHKILKEQLRTGMSLCGALNTCHACGQITNTRSDIIEEAIEFEDSDRDFHARSSLYGAWIVSEESTEDDFIDSSLAEEDTGRVESDLTDIFFSDEQCTPLMMSVMSERERKELVVENDDVSQDTPWLSSKPDAYDFADVMLDLCQSNNRNTNDHHLTINNGQSKDDKPDETGLERIDTQEPRDDSNPSATTVAGTKSDYFAVRTTERPANSILRHWLCSKTPPVKHLAAALQVENVHVLKGAREIKISKNTLAKLQVIRQVDRKFILVQADTSRGKLVLCIDQHAADERVRLEKLEEDMFGRDGSLRRVEIQEHEPPLELRSNFKEREVLSRYEELIQSWGFDFEFVTSDLETTFFKHKDPLGQDQGRVLLYTTPKVEKRVANGDDFRDFIQLLSCAGETYPHSQIRPPVITRLLHSRACRSAIMFGDRLSLGQCKDLIEELKTCQLPFQCAHGRPSVVPLVEIRKGGHINDE